MKKVILFAVSAFAAFSMSAQIYVGGSLGFSSSKLKFADDDKLSGSSFQIRPEVGYKLDDRMSIGIELGYTQGIPTFGNISYSDFKGALTSVASAATDLIGDKELDMSIIRDDYIHQIDASSIKITGLAVAPYFRYNFVTNKYFDLFAEARIGYTAGKLKANIDAYAYGGNPLLKDSDISVNLNLFEVSFRPGIAVKITDRINLTAKLGYLGYQNLSLGFDDAAKKFGIEKDEVAKPKLSRFGLNLDANNIIFGLTYNFK